MYRMNIPDTRKYTKENRRRRMWRRILSAMASIVVFCTTYALILPAITLEAQPSPEATEAIVQTQPTEETVAPETVPAETEVPPAQVTPGGGTVSADAPEVEESTTASTEPTTAPTTEPTAEPTQAPTEAPTEPPMAEPEEIVDEELTQSGVSDEPVSGDPAAVDLAGDGEQTDASTTALLDVTSYIKDATLKYKKVGENNWSDVNGATDIPGNAVFQLDVTYGDVPIETLKNAGYQMTYELPDLLRDAVASGDLTDSNNKPVGTIEASGNLVTLKFDEKWIADLTKPSKSEQDNPQEGETTQKQQVLNGTFYVQATANLSNIPDGGSTSITIGKVDIKINFEGDVLAKRADITLTKSEPKLEQTGDGDYLKYTLTVTAGQDECLGVYVEDKITEGAKNVDGYVGLDGNDKVNVAEDKKSFTWTIGDMKAGEVRELTYRVELKKGFLGGEMETGQNVINTAQAFTGKDGNYYPHGKVSSHYTAKGDATLSKQYRFDKEAGIIYYTIWVQAKESNTYNLEHVYIKDGLDGSANNDYPTDENIRKHLSFVVDSFKLYKGGSDRQNGAENLEFMDEIIPTFGETNDVHNTYFLCDVGPLTPGECRTLTYALKVDPGVYAAGGNDNFTIHNRVALYDNAECKEHQYERWLEKTNIDHKVWSRKMVGTLQETEQTITMTGAGYTYDAATKEVTKIDSLPESFIVPKDSYRYQIIVNEAGNWDLSSAVMTDSLHMDYLQYAGYVQVSAYKMEDDATAGSGTAKNPAGVNFGSNEVAAGKFHEKTAAKTVWVQVDGQTRFEFKPEELNMGGEYAYVLTYYAKVFKHGSTNVLVANDFILSGEVGYGGVRYQLTGIKATVSVDVASGSYFAAQKRFWYFDRLDGEGSKGTLYWILQIDGSPIYEGVQIRDTIPAGGGLNDLKNIGVYRSSKELTAAMTVKDLDDMSKVSNDQVDVVFDDNSLIYTVKRDLDTTNSEHLYIVVSSTPNSLPSASWDYRTFVNGLETRSNDQTEWSPEGNASHTIFGGGELIKALGKVFTYVPNEDTNTKGTVVEIESGKLHQSYPEIQWDKLTQSGIYTSWHIRVNQGGTLNGTYRIEEKIPKGMECVYVWRCSTKGVGNNVTFKQIDALQAEGWTSVSQNYSNQTNAIYYVNDQRVVWEIDLKNGTPGDSYTEFQIVCKVTDPDVLQGGIEKTFTNTVYMTNADSVQIGVDSNAVTIQSKSLAKDGTYDPKTNGGVYPFKITVNDLGTDLVPGSDTIKLIDELSDTLILDPTSIQVVNTKTGDAITNYKPSVNNNVLTLELPDNLPLTITYNATINAAPEEKISISNNAYWEGYATSSGSSVEVKDFFYKVGGTVGTSEKPTLTITKLDQNNATLKLPGAKFELVEVKKLENGEWKEISNGKTFTGTTGADGTLTFGKDDSMLEFNTVYRLTETIAPTGYVLDNKPYYFAVLQKDGESYPAVPDEVQPIYTAASTHTAYNHKGEAEVKKLFQNAGGEALEKIDGTYKFGIFKGENGNVGEKPVQTVSITFKSGEVNSGTAKFTNLELGETYTIYELDDKDNPIKPGSSAVVSGMPFVVSYSEGQTIKVEGGEVPTVTVTNRMNYAELPATGGPGPGALYLSGLALIFAALVLLKKRKTA